MTPGPDFIGPDRGPGRDQNYFIGPDQSLVRQISQPASEVGSLVRSDVIRQWRIRGKRVTYDSWLAKYEFFNQSNPSMYILYQSLPFTNFYIKINLFIGVPLTLPLTRNLVKVFGQDQEHVHCSIILLRALTGSAWPGTKSRPIKSSPDCYCSTYYRSEYLKLHNRIVFPWV